MENDTIALTLLFILIFVSIIVIGILIYYCYSGGNDSLCTTDTFSIDNINTTINNNLTNFETNNQNRRVNIKANLQSTDVQFPSIFATQNEQNNDENFRNPSNYNLPNGLQFSSLEPPIIKNNTEISSLLSILNNNHNTSQTKPNLPGILNLHVSTVISNNIENGKIIEFTGSSSIIATLPTGSISGLILHFLNSSSVNQTLNANVNIMDNNVGTTTINLNPGQFITVIFVGSKWIVSHKNCDNSLIAVLEGSIINNNSQLISNENINTSKQIDNIDAELKAMLNRTW
jgi:hypothetical protein